MLSTKRILLSVSVIAVAGAVVIGGTRALFTDTETSTGNVFTAGSIDLKVDHAYASYNGEECVGRCVEQGSNLVANGGFETPDIAAGTWTVYASGSEGTTSWVIESGPGLEIQDNVAGAPHSGGQHAELDSNSSSAISQTITTEVGKQYHLKFWYSPRPGRPAGDNTIGAKVIVMGDGGGELVNAIIGADAVGEGTTNWVEYVYPFVADSTSTKIMFSDLGTSTSYGGYLDDISVYSIKCGEYTQGGTCTLWGERDLGKGDYFWNFTDVKPGDHGINIISLHVYNNDAYACFVTEKIDDQDNTLTDPELDLGDTLVDGELDNYLKLFVWDDANRDNAYNNGETIYADPDSSLSVALERISLAESDTKYIGIAWCAGTQSFNDSHQIVCDGSTMLNDAQTDSITATITALAEQQRNNSNFVCPNQRSN